MSLAVISIYVPDLAAAKAFYTDVLGFSVEEEHGDYVVQLKNDGPALLLCAGGSARTDAYPAGPVIGLPTRDAAAEIKRLKGRKVKVLHDEPQPFPGGVFAAFVDPFGNGIELLQFAR